MMFTLYGEDFVDSVNQVLRSQSLNSSVSGVLVSDQQYEESTMYVSYMFTHTSIFSFCFLFRVATIILSYFNDTILSQLGDIENYIASYIYDNRDQLSIETARVNCGKPRHHCVTPCRPVTVVCTVHSRKVSSMSSEPETYHRGWMFVAGSSSNPDSSVNSHSTGSVATGSVATVRYNMVEFTLGHSHSFGYGVNKKRSEEGGRAVPKEIAELDDDFFEWYKFKVFHARNVDSVSENTKEWRSMTWNERSLQQTADTVWSGRGKSHTSAGAIAGTVASVGSVGIVTLAIVGYVIARRRKRKQAEQTPSLDKLVTMQLIQR